jgi:hypothetical protein
MILIQIDFKQCVSNLYDVHSGVVLFKTFRFVTALQKQIGPSNPIGSFGTEHQGVHFPYRAPRLSLLQK